MNSFTKIRPRLVDDTSGVFSRSRRWIPLDFAPRARARPAPGPPARTGPPGAAQLDLQARTTWATPHTRQRQRPWRRIAGRRVPRCPSHSSRGGLPQRWTQQSSTTPPHIRHGADASLNGGEVARSFRLVRLVIAARRSLPVEEGLGSSPWAARPLKNIFASRLWPSGLSRVATRQSSTPAIELARWRAKSLGHF